MRSVWIYDGGDADSEHCGVRRGDRQNDGRLRETNREGQIVRAGDCVAGLRSKSKIMDEKWQKKPIVSVVFCRYPKRTGFLRPPTTMRLSLWIGLIFAFSVGMGCALVMRAVYFEAKPVVIRSSEPTTKILVATKTIPDGIEITAEFVAFQDVPLSEVPAGALSDFNRVYRRQPAFPIPEGCPICEDLLLPFVETAAQAAFIPAGSQIVTLDVVQVRQGHNVFPPKEPLAAVLAADQRVDIRVVPRNETPGRLAEIRNQVLQAFSAYNFRNSGELILENIPIHRIQRRYVADHVGKDSLVLMLGKSEAARLASAARRGQIRVLVHSRDEKREPEPTRIDNVFEVAHQYTPQQFPLPPLPLQPDPVQSSPDPLPSGQPAEPSDVPFVQEQPPQELPEPLPEPPPAGLTENVRRILSVSAENIDDSELLSDPDSVPLPIHVPVHAAAEIVQIPVVRLPHTSGQQLNSSLTLVLPEADEESKEERILIRNENPGVSLGASSPRTLPVEQAARQNLTLSRSLPTSESEQKTLFQPRPNMEILRENQRATQSIQFVTPNDSAPDHLRGEMKRSETVAMPPGTAFAAMPSIQTLQERVQGYSPFERRVYTVLPSENNSGIPKEEELVPPMLLKTPML